MVYFMIIICFCLIAFKMQMCMTILLQYLDIASTSAGKGSGMASHFHCPHEYLRISSDDQDFCTEIVL